jgi:hypothetical protein
MRTAFRIAFVGLLAAVAAQPVAAQDELIGFDQVYQLFSGKQPRAAVQMMGVVSAGFRQELGRCHDEAIGGRMMQTEPKIDALGVKLAAGGVTSADVLEKEFAEYDHLLAEHHQQLAAEGWAKPRFNKMETVARDLAHAAHYLVRAGHWTKQPLTGEAQKAVDDALAVAKRLAADPGSPPPETQAVIDALGRMVKRPTR